MRNFSLSLLVMVLILPFTASAQTSDDIILELLRSLEGPVVTTPVATTTTQTVPNTPKPIMTLPTPTAQEKEVLLPFHLFSVDGNEPTPDPNEVALKGVLQSLLVQFAALSASKTQAPVLATTTATTTEETVPEAPARKPFLRNLQQGSRGADVTALQEFLIARGHLFGEPTGYFGVLTKTALITLQTELDLPAFGLFGPLTREILNALPVERFSSAPPPQQSLGPVSIPLIASSTGVSASTSSQMGTSTDATGSSTPLFDLWAPPVSVSMSILPSEAPIGGSVAVTWLSQNATSCVASDGWEGTKAPLGAATIEPLQFSLNLMLTCTGPGGIASTSALIVVGEE